MASSGDLEIALHFEDGAICGTLRTDGGSPSGFTGWLGLIASIDRVVRSEVAGPGSAAEGEQSGPVTPNVLTGGHAISAAQPNQGDHL